MNVATFPCSRVTCARYRSLAQVPPSDRVLLTVDGIAYRFCSLACFCIFVRSNYMESRSQGGAA